MKEILLSLGLMQLFKARVNDTPNIKIVYVGFRIILFSCKLTAAEVKTVRRYGMCRFVRLATPKTLLCLSPESQLLNAVTTVILRIQRDADRKYA